METAPTAAVTVPPVGPMKPPSRTVIVVWALLPSLVAVIAAVPTATPVTRPAVLTVAIPEADVLQSTTRPVSGLPCASFGVATNVNASFGTKGPAGNDNAMLATGMGVTVSVASPLTPSLVARICTDPGVTAVTRPPVDTVATASAVDVQVTALPLSVLPWASRGVAVICTVAPTCTNCRFGETKTDAIAGGAGGGGGGGGAVVPPPHAPVTNSRPAPTVPRIEFAFIGPPWCLAPVERSCETRHRPIKSDPTSVAAKAKLSPKHETGSGPALTHGQQPGSKLARYL